MRLRVPPLYISWPRNSGRPGRFWPVPPRAFGLPSAYVPVMPRAAPRTELFQADAGPRPLAERLRPAALQEIVGQDHLLGPAGTLTRMLERAPWRR
jgi:hypothetical protein